MNRDWLAVFEALRRVYTEGAYSNIAINEALLRHKGCKESFVRNFAKGVLRSSIRLDYIIDMLATGGMASVSSRPLIILRMGIYAAYGLGSVPDHAAVSEAVNLSKFVAKGSDRFINAVLRSFIRKRNEIAVPMDRLDLKYSVSKDIVNLLKEQYGDETEEILKALSSPAAAVIRVNTLKTDRKSVMEELKDAGFDALAAEESSNAIIVKGSGVVESSLFREGLISIQSLSSMMAIEALNPSPGSRVLDMCSSPGGKCAYMAELMKGKGSIIACDIHQHRVELINKTCQRLGIDMVSSRISDGTVYDDSLKEAFDYVLSDVPCSGLGVMGSKPELSFTCDAASFEGLVEIQKAILQNAVKYVRYGGRIEYSTCTLNKNENEKVVDEILRDRKEGFLNVLEMRTVLPYNHKVGFFYAILEKNRI